MKTAALGLSVAIGVFVVFGLPILAIFLVYFQRPLSMGELAWFPVAVLVQLTLTLGLAALFP